MSYSRDKANDFWYEFDRIFLFERSNAVNAAMAGVYGPDNFSLDKMVDRVRDNRNDLAAQLVNRRESILTLANMQLEVMRTFFSDSADLQLAFEDFGQGVLFDDKRKPDGRPRRTRGNKVHMMDGTPDEQIGYHRWHAFIRAAVASGANASEWLEINRFVGYAWAIYSRTNAVQDNPANVPLSAQELAPLRAAWLTMDAESLNDAFLSYVGDFPTDYFPRRARETETILYQRVQRILSNAAPNSHPRHSGHGRFWEKNLADFLSTQVYGYDLIAPPGPNRGRESALVQVLRGELEDVPPMPLGRPALPAEDIEFIERWIDSLPT